jgi:hypothetical protein
MAQVTVELALVAFLVGVCGALIRGFWGVSHDCQAWAASQGYQLMQNDWWAKNQGLCSKNARR